MLMRDSLHLKWWRRWTCHYRIPMSSSKSQLPLPYHLRRSRLSRLQSLSTVIQSLRVAPRKKDSKPSNVIRLKSRSCSDKIRFIVSASLRHSRRRLLSRPKSKYTKKRNNNRRRLCKRQCPQSSSRTWCSSPSRRTTLSNQTKSCQIMRDAL